jgi:heme A synthase
MSRVARFAWGVLVANVGVILWGAYVRATGSGAGCGGHWPTCNGVVIPRSPSVSTLIELSHRASSGLAFFAVMALGVVVLWKTDRGARARVPAVASMVLMGCEVLIGAAIVVLGHVALDPSVAHGVFTELHAGNTFLLLGALTLTAHHLTVARAAPSFDAAPVSPFRGVQLFRAREGGAPVVLLGTALLGIALTVGSGAIAALGDTLFPARSLYDGFVQDLTPGAHLFLHLRTLHPVLALAAFVLLLQASFSLRARRDVPSSAQKLAGWVIVGVTAQAAIGVLNLWLLVPIPMQMVHLAGADVLFILFVRMAAYALGGPSDARVATPSVPVSWAEGSM